MSSNSLYSMSLFMYAYKESSSGTGILVLGLIGTSFCYLESVGKCNEAYQTNQSLEIGE